MLQDDKGHWEADFTFVFPDLSAAVHSYKRFFSFFLVSSEAGTLGIVIGTSKKPGIGKHWPPSLE